MALAFAPSARADGDPAGDVLAHSSRSSTAARWTCESEQAAQLPALLERAKAAGYELRVAAMSVQQDMGAIDYLWDDPLNYVDFLAPGARLPLPRTRARDHAERLRDVPARATRRVRDQRVLDKLAPAGADPAAVLPGALDAVVALAGARGIELTRARTSTPAPGGVKQPGSHFAAASGRATGSASRSTRPATSGGGGGAWLFALPVVAARARGRRADRPRSCATGADVPRRSRRSRATRARCSARARRRDGDRRASRSGRRVADSALSRRAALALAALVPRSPRRAAVRARADRRGPEYVPPARWPLAGARGVRRAARRASTRATRAHLELFADRQVVVVPGGIGVSGGRTELYGFVTDALWTAHAPGRCSPAA